MIKKKRPFLGRAIVDGKIRYTSVSQIKMFDRTVDGGCPRKWAYAYVFRIKLERTDRQKEGSTDAELLEHYLTTGEDVLSPTLQPAKKLFPAPGPDLECEKPFGDIERAVALRDDTFKMRQPQLLQEEIERAAGLTFFGIPVDGAADIRHRRGEFIDSDKILKKDPPGLRVVHIEDLKTVSRIFPHKVLKGPNAGNIIPAFTKTNAEVCEDPQMVGYARHGVNLYPDATHFRLGHIYASTTKREAEKRTGIISVEQVLERSARLDGVVGQMAQVAGAQRIEDVEAATSSCDAYRHVDPNDPTKTLPGCGYRYQCPLHITQVVNNMLGTYKESAMSLMDQIPGFGTPPSDPVTNGTHPQAPPLDPAAHQAAVEAEKARLRAQLAALTGAPQPPAPPAIPAVPAVATFEQAEYGYCTLCSAALNRTNGSKLPTGQSVHIDCPKVAGVVPKITVTGPPAPVPVAPSPAPAPPPPQLPISVNPPDQPRVVDMVAAADPPPPSEVAQITDPALRAQIEQHAREHAARAAAAAAQQEAEKAAAGTSVWCAGGSVKLPVTGDMSVEGYTCACGKHWSIKTLKPSKEGNGYVVDIPRHKPKKNETQEVQQPVQATLPVSALVTPVVPVIPNSMITPVVPQIPTPAAAPPTSMQAMWPSGPVDTVPVTVTAPAPAPIPTTTPSVPTQALPARETKSIIARTEQMHRVTTVFNKTFFVLAPSLNHAMNMVETHSQEKVRGLEILVGEVLDVG